MTSKAWKRVLYEEQDFPDNYVPDSFLSELKINRNVEIHSYSQLVFNSVVLTQQFCVICLFILSWWFMGNNTILPETIFFVSVFFCLLGYFLYLNINQFCFEQSKILNDFKTAILLLGFAALFSPVLDTLTHTISTDTIYTMATLMFLGHFAYHDYDVDAVFASRPVSLTMSVFAAVCLASRLNAVFPTFVTVVLAYLLFGLWPPLRRCLWKHKPSLLHVVASFMYVVVFLGFYMINTVSCIVFLLLLICIVFLMPALLLSMQHKKHNINGPWDEAVINDDELISF